MEDELLKSLKTIPVPEPTEKARREALAAAMQAFDNAAEAEKTAKTKKNVKVTQGSPAGVRLIDVLTQPWRWIMKKQLIIGTALASLLVGVFVMQHQETLDQQVRPQHPPTAPSATPPNRVASEPTASEVLSESAPSVPEPVAEKPRISKRTDADMLVPPKGERQAGMPAMVAPSSPQSTRALSEMAPSPMPLSAKRKVMADHVGNQAGFMAPSDIIMPPQSPYQGRDQFEHKETNPMKKVAEEPVSTFSIDVDTAAYAFVRKQLNQGVLPQKDAVRVEEMVNYFDYDYPRPESTEVPFKPTVAVYPAPWNAAKKLVHIGIKGYEIEQAVKPRSNLVFLLDVSGSMNSPDKLPLLKNAFRLMVENLQPDDTVAIVTYAGNAGTVLEPTKVSEKQKILSALDGLNPGGSTAGAQGITQAYALAESSFDKEGVNRVILATDGDFNVGITNREELKSYIERKRDSGIFLSVIGFGQGNYNDALMQTLAQNGNGVAAYIDTLSEARKVLVEEAGSTLFPIAKDVKIQVEFNPANVSEYRLIGYETRMLNREDFNNDKVDAGDIGSGHTVTAIYEITPVGSEAQMIDDLRYGTPKQESVVIDTTKASDEYAFLKLRYKLPEESKSHLISQPITAKQEVADAANLPAELRFAAAVAGFGQLLRGGEYTGDFSYDDVIALAQGARGDDPFGYRSEFLNLVRLAKSARAM